MKFLTSYTKFQKDRGSRGGGLCIYVKETFGSSLISTSNSIEQLWINLKLKKEKYAIGVIYRPPSQDSNFFISEFEEALSLITPLFNNIICTGDFNFNLYNFNSTNIRNFYSVLDEFDLTQIINSPTRITNITATLIDLIIVRKEDTVLEKGVVDNELSDHGLIYCTIKTNDENSAPRIITYRNFKNFDINLFEQDLFNIPFFVIFDLHHVDNKLEYLNNALQSLFDKHAPTVTSKLTKPHAPWLTDTVKRMIKIRDNALLKFKKTGQHRHWIFYKQIRNFTSQSIIREKKAYLNYKLNQSDPSLHWKILRNNNIISNKIIRNLPNHLSNANEANDYFVNALPATTVSQVTLNNYKNNSLFDSTFKFQEVNELTVLNIINGIKKNAIGTDGLNIKMIKLCSPHIVPFLVHIINFCLTQNVFPNAWKSAVITAVPKKSNPVEFRDLRAISILPVFSKIIEKIIEEQLRRYLIEKKVLPPIQSGFRSGYSCTTALLHVVDDVSAAIDKGHCTILVLLDFSRAFDTISHDLLLSILHYIGLTEDAIKFFENYLKGRQQKVLINNNSSNYIALRSGVPQGSILGPLLFAIYTSQFTKCLTNCQIHLYADDTQLYYSFNPSDVDGACYHINEDLELFVDSAREHSLFINADKSNVIIFGPKKIRSNIKNIAKIKIDGNELEIVEKAKSLGVIMDCDLRFEDYINTLTRKAYGTIKLIYGNRRFLPRDTKILLCESLVLSILNYADSLYGPNLTLTYKSKIQKIQNSCLRLIYGIRRRERISFKLSEIGWLNMERRRLLHAACLYHKIIVNRCPPYLYQKLKFRTDVHALNLRFRGLLTPPVHRTEFFKRSFSYQICKVYNSLPGYLKLLKRGNFKRKYKQLLFSSQCEEI